MFISTPMNDNCFYGEYFIKHVVVHLIYVQYNQIKVFVSCNNIYKFPTIRAFWGGWVGVR